MESQDRVLFAEVKFSMCGETCDHYTVRPHSNDRLDMVWFDPVTCDKGTDFSGPCQGNKGCYCLGVLIFNHKFRYIFVYDTYP